MTDPKLAERLRDFSEYLRTHDPSQQDTFDANDLDLLRASADALDAMPRWVSVPVYKNFGEASCSTAPLRRWQR